MHVHVYIHHSGYNICHCQGPSALCCHTHQEKEVQHSELCYSQLTKRQQTQNISHALSTIHVSTIHANIYTCTVYDVQTHDLMTGQGGIRQGTGFKTQRSPDIHGLPLVQLGVQIACPVGSYSVQSSSGSQ